MPKRPRGKKASRYHRQCDRAASVITSEEPEELKPNHVKYVAAEGQGTGSTDEPGTQIARILAAKKMEQAAENQVTDRGKGTESIPGHRGACIKAVRIPEEADPRTEHSRDPGCFAGEMVNPGGNYERLDLYRRVDRRHHVHTVVSRAPLMLATSNAAGRVEISEPTVPVVVGEGGTTFVQWSAIIGGALVALALSLVLIAFGSAIGLAILSTSPTWRDVSPALTLASGIYLLLTALVSFGFGGYVAGRLRERWHSTAHNNVVEFRDGVHGVLSWAVSAGVSGLLIAASLAGAASKVVAPATSPPAATGEPLIAYELDRLFRAERHPQAADLNYSRAEAGRILLAATGRQGITPEDRTYLVRLVAAETGAAPPDAERRVDVAITAATTAVHKARRSAVILGFCTAASLLAGAVAAWYAACAGGRHRDEVAPPLEWRWSRG